MTLTNIRGPSDHITNSLSSLVDPPTYASRDKGVLRCAHTLTHICFHTCVHILQDSYGHEGTPLIILHTDTRTHINFWYFIVQN